MKKNLLIKTISLIILVLMGIGAVFLYTSVRKYDLPASFTIKFTQENTSSAAERDYSATLVFKNNELVSGEQTYDAGNQHFDTHDTCLLENRSWIDSASKSACSIHAQYFRYVKDSDGGYGGSTTEGSVPPLTIADIEAHIKSGYIAPLNTAQCQRFMLCYEIVK